MYTIGEFSRLCRVSARMLRHYDRIGLLHPALVDGENGYRYYGPEQLPLVRRIHRLSGYGFSLAEVGGLLHAAPQELAARLRARHSAARSELEALQAALRHMEWELAELEEPVMNEITGQITVMETPAQRVLGIRRTVRPEELHELFQELHREVARLGLRRTGAVQQMYLGEEYDGHRMDIEAQIQVEGEGEGVHTIPACTCAAMVHTGPRRELGRAYDAMAGWLAAHPEYTVCGPVTERYLSDEPDGDPSGCRTGILYPIRKIR